MAAVAVILSTGAASAEALHGKPGAAPARSDSVSLAKLVGQTILVRMPGAQPTAAFLARIRSGQIGGVVIYSENLGTAGPAALIRQLQAAAAEGRNPPLVIGIDQEGGIVKRLQGAPSLTPGEMINPFIAEAQGLSTARNLASYGINVDLAPVLDVGRGGFIAPRTFANTAAEVSVRGVAFARGLLDGHVMPTAKHFPGLGYASTTTDNGPVVVNASKHNLIEDLAPFQAAITAGVPIVLVSTATYPGLGVKVPAACSGTIVQQLLRKTLAFKGVVITDALDTTAVTKYLTVPSAAVAAIRNGADMVIAAGNTSADANQVSIATYARLLAAARRSSAFESTLALAYKRIVQLKARLV